MADEIVQKEDGRIQVILDADKREPQHKEDVVAVRNPMYLLELAINKDADVDKLEKLMALKERWDAEEARKAYIQAMSEFQSKCPAIRKTKKGGETKAGVVAYYYAPLESMVAQTQQLVKECGFSYTFDTPIQKETGVEVAITVSHIQGHSKTSTVFMPFVSKTGVMSDPQVIGATMTYAKRYAYANAFGIMTMDDDTDAVDEETTTKFTQLIQHWDVSDHLVSIAKQMISKNAFNQFIMTIPNAEQVTSFKSLLAKIDVKYHQQLWTDFQKQTKSTADDWLTKLSASKLIKQTEVKNE